MTYLLDTNVISEIRKRHPDPHVVAWWETVTSAEVFISALTIGEIRLGVERLRRKDSAQADLLEQWLHGLRGYERRRHFSTPGITWQGYPVVPSRAGCEWIICCGRAGRRD